MQHIDAFGERRDIEDSMLAPGSDPNLSNTRPHGSHRFPVVRLQTLLNSTQLEAGDPPGETWECPDIRTGRPKPEDPLVGHASLCKYSYIMSTMAGRSVA
jgi:hypothetical protein